MTTHGNLTHSGRYPPQTFLITSGDKVCDVTDLVNAGAKLDVVVDYLRDEWDAPKRRGKPADWVYYSAYRAVNRWVKAGTAEKLSNYLHSLYPGLIQKSGVFVRAKTTPTHKQPRLINDLQNSKSFVSPQKPLRLDQHTKPCSTQTAVARAEQLTAAEPSHPLDHYNAIPGRCGFWRQQAIRTMKSIDQYNLFTRDKNGKLPAELLQYIRRMTLIFEEWKRETESKSIILRNLTGNGEYITLPCSTRFTDDSRKKQLILIYNTGVENSLKKHKIASFVTFTTDPLIWMESEGKEILRKIPDPHIDKVHRFTATGRGGNLYAANRHESNAFRKWYETECHRVGYRIPYIRCVEFQENGLIHDHVILFDYEWKYPFSDFAEQWGTKYGQGFMHDAYSVINDGEKWTWKTDKPADTEGRNPTDYLKKYLIKALYDESGHYAYWVTNKRFFTLSNSIRYLTVEDEIRQKQFRRQHAPTDTYEYIGTAPQGHENAAIRADLSRRAGLKPEKQPPANNHGIIENYPPLDPGNIAPQIWYVPPPELEDLENPNQQREPITNPPPAPGHHMDNRIQGEAIRLPQARPNH
nr:hypothetical protein [Methanocorpusculum sp.]